MGIVFIFNGCHFNAPKRIQTVNCFVENRPPQQLPPNYPTKPPLISRIYIALSKKREQQRKALPLPETRLEMLDVWESL